MIGLFVFMLAVFVIYIGAIVRSYGIPKSVSDSYYLMPVKYRPLFTFFCWGIAIPAFIIATSPYMFVAGTAIALVGAANAFHDKFIYKFHMPAAIIAVLASQAYIMFDQDLMYLSIGFVSFVALVVLVTGVFKKDFKYFFWIEIAAFFCIFYTFYLKLFTV